jgi:hypothetical protein
MVRVSPWTAQKVRTDWQWVEGDSKTANKKYDTSNEIEQREIEGESDALTRQQKQIQYE